MYSWINWSSTALASFYLSRITYLDSSWRRSTRGIERKEAQRVTSGISRTCDDVGRRNWISDTISLMPSFLHLCTSRSSFDMIQIPFHFYYFCWTVGVLFFKNSIKSPDFSFPSSWSLLILTTQTPFLLQLYLLIPSSQGTNIRYVFYKKIVRCHYYLYSFKNWQLWLTKLDYDY